MLRSRDLSLASSLRSYLQTEQSGGLLEAVVLWPRDLSLTSSLRSSARSLFNRSIPDSTSCDSYLSYTSSNLVEIFKGYADARTAKTSAIPVMIR